MSVSKKTVLFLRRGGFTYCDPVINSQVSQTFTGSEVKDLEIINEDLLTREMGAFIAANMLEPAVVTIILEKDTLFEKRFVKEELEKKNDINLSDLEKKFANDTPFENVSSKIIYYGKDVLILSTNASLFLAIKRILDSHGFVVSSVLPIAVPELQEVKEPSVENSRLILGKAESLKADNFMVQEIKKDSSLSLNAKDYDNSTQNKELQGTDNKPQKSKRLPILIGFFALLIGILFYMVIGIFLQN